jgi:hypothetical protein
MGLVRKTLSVSTLGLIPFRSKKEKLRTAVQQRDAAAEALKAVEANLERAKQRVAEAELLALKEAGRANKAQRAQAKDVQSRRKRRRAKAGSALVAVEERVKPLSGRAKKELLKAERRAEKAAGHTFGVIEEKAEQLSRRAGKKLAKAQKKTQKRARRLGKDAEVASRHALDKAREAAVAQVESVHAAVGGS